MPTTLNTQLLYNWAGQPVPVPVKVGDKEQQTLRASDFMESMGKAEAAFGQFVISQNQDAQRVLSLVNSQGFAAIDTTGITDPALLATATQVNSVINVLTSLVKTSS